MKVFGIIPARLDSTRLPGKLLLDETGKPLLQHTWERANESKCLDALYIATPSLMIANAAIKFGAEVVMTPECRTGMDRVAWAASTMFDRADVYVNIQGDEPELDPSHIDLLVRAMDQFPSPEITTLSTPFRDEKEAESESVVKVIVGGFRRALYFTRKPLVGAERHVGLYAYTRDALLLFSQSSPPLIEEAERLEQLRALYHGALIRVESVASAAPGIDTAEEYAAFVERWRNSSR